MDFFPKITMDIHLTNNHLKLDPKNPEFYNNPYPYYKSIHKKTSMFFWEDYSQWCFAGHAEVDAILRDRRFGRQIDHLASREELGLPPEPPEFKDLIDVDRYSILSLEPPAHTRIRKLVQKAFMSRQIAGMRLRIEELCHSLIDNLEDQGPGDMLPVYAVPIPVMIIAEMLGVPTEMADQLLDWSHAIVKTYQIGCPYENKVKAQIASVEFMDYLRELINERRQDPREDLLTYMINVKDDEGHQLSEAELLSNSILLLNAGHEATVNQTGNAVLALLKNPAQLADFKAHPEIAPTAVDELIRFDTPLHFFERWVLEDLEFHGKSFKFGESVAVLLGAANRDPRVFDRPDELDLRRKKNPQVSFGGGIHYCLGAPLARLELQVSLPILFERLPNLYLLEEPVFMDSYHFRGLEALRVGWA